MRERAPTPLETRVTTPVAWLLAAVFASIGGLIVLRVHHVVRSGDERLLDRIAQTAAHGSGRVPLVDGVSLAIVTPDGRVRAGHLPATLARDVPGAFARRGTSVVLHAGGETAVLRHVRRSGKDVAVVAASRLPEADQQRLIAVEAEGLVPIGLAALGVAIVLFERAARRHRRRIERLGTVAARLDRGELDARTGERSGDELGGVGVQLDVLAGRLQRLERSRGTVLSQVSHDLRSPLALIRAYAWVLRKEEASPARSDRLQTIEEEAERVASLVEDLLLVGRRSAAGPAEAPSEISNVGVLAARVVDRRVAQARDAGLLLELELPEREALVAIRESAVERIVGNLVENALRHASQRVRLQVVLEDDVVELTCADDGPGIPADELAHLFEPFWRGSAGPGGSGLGLTITRELAAAAGGGVRAENAAGGGARMIVELPHARRLVGGAV
jgi:signal transduction histidine kinase